MPGRADDVTTLTWTSPNKQVQWSSNAKRTKNKGNIWHKHIMRYIDIDRACSAYRNIILQIDIDA